MDTHVTTLDETTVATGLIASVIEIHLKAGKTNELATIAHNMKPDLEQISGLKQFILIERGLDQALAVSFYESRAHQENATPKAQELLARWSHLVTVPPQRIACKIIVNENF